MKIATIVSTLALSVSVAHAAQSAADFPGICKSEADCKVYGTNYACVSVDSSVAGLETLSMCIPGGTVCSGQISGACPTFAAWPKAYRVVQPVCVLVPVLNCNKKFAVSAGSATGTNADVGAASTTGSGTVECYVRNFTTATQYKVVEGIYQCVDYAKYLSSNFGYLQNLTDATTAACAYSSITQTLCSGQGTCAPKSSFAQEYQCKCNKGYDGTANCSTVTSNQCSSLGQCGTLGTCTVAAGASTGTCSCKAGSTGNQCTKCDATSTSACSGHGTCDASGVCTCASKYSGTFCADSTSTSGTSMTPTPASGSARLSSFVATAIATGMTIAAVGIVAFAS
ncbi:hypothetical protein PybrP1_001899 [[Pythium] brassicae (nom. inval.)]|nr:hypothetical protein PybrP1_001899 [[Pythium] brassicae (nom. inval.)]